MYIGVKKAGPRTRYYIRESFLDGTMWKSRDLFSLGRDPEKFVVYIGDNSFYLDQKIEDHIRSIGVEVDPHEMDRLFQPFIKVHIRERMARFDRSGSRKSPYHGYSYAKLRELQKHIHMFDKRRLHFLRLGRMDQGLIKVKPYRFFNILLNKSRDELEHIFAAMENELQPTELKNYVYVIFDLQRHFLSRPTRFIPLSMDQEKLDELLVQDLCELVLDQAYLSGSDSSQALQEYLVRYLIMFFDYNYGPENTMGEYIRTFMDNRRFFRPPPPTQASDNVSDALKIFGIGERRFKAMTMSDLTSIYRKKAHHHHPDRGGEHENFVRLNHAYQTLLALKGKNKKMQFRRRY